MPRNRQLMWTGRSARRGVAPGPGPGPVGPPQMVMEVDLSKPGVVNNTFTFYASRTSSMPPFTIDWGDGDSETIADTSSSTPRTHTYADNGTYSVKVIGTLNTFGNAAGNQTAAQIAALTAVSRWDAHSVTSLASAFRNAQNLASVVPPPWGVTNFNATFLGSSFNGDISAWDMSAATATNQMFMNAAAFNGDISGWKTGAVTDMSQMFMGAAAFNRAIGGWDTGRVTNMGFMFSGASSFVQNISAWNVALIPTEPGGFATNTNPLWTPAMRPVWGTTGGS